MDSKRQTREAAVSMLKCGMAFFVAVLLGSTAHAQIVLLTEDFEVGSPPAGWSTTQNTPSVGWEFGTDLGSQYFPIPAHGRYAVSNDDAHDDNSATANLADLDYLISPPIDLLAWAGTGVGLHFSYVQPSTFGSVGTVEVRLNGGPWVVAATVPPATNWTEFGVDLSAFTTSTIVEIGFHHDDNGFWADGFAVDDVTVSTLPPLDAALDEVLTSGYLATGTVDLEAAISNQGANHITSVGVAYRINGGPIETGTLLGLALGTGDRHVFPHPVPAQLAAVGTYQIEMWITAVNGGPDLNTANNFATSEVITVSRVPPKKAILTNHTGAWCGFCPDGYVRLEQALDLYGNLIGVSVHESDDMSVADGEELNSTYISGYPAGLIDIYRFPDLPSIDVSRAQWNDRADERLHHIVPVSVSLVDVSFDPATREILVTVRAEFFGQAPGQDLRINLWVVEDGVTGSGPGYDQTNYYDTDPTHPYFGAGDPIIGFVHDRTLRAMLGGTWGTPGIIPPTVAAGDVATHTYSYILPSGSDEARISLVGLVSTYDAGNEENRSIFNSARRSLWGIFDDGFEWGDTADWAATTP